MQSLRHVWPFSVICRQEKCQLNCAKAKPMFLKNDHSQHYLPLRLTTSNALCITCYMQQLITAQADIYHDLSSFIVNFKRRGGQEMQHDQDEDNKMTSLLNSPISCQYQPACHRSWIGSASCGLSTATLK